MIRPEVRAALLRWRESIMAAAVVALGLWLIGLGGWLFLPFGLLVAGLGLALVLLAHRRMRFGRGGGAPGIVEVDEGQIAYLGPTEGGFVSIAELVELRLVHLRGQRLWRLKQADGQALLIPVAAEGAERLFDAFAQLPAMDSQALVAALKAAPGAASGATTVMAAADGTRLGPVIWRRPAHLALSRGS